MEEEEGFPKFCEAFDGMGYDRDTKASSSRRMNEFPYEWLDSYDKLLWPVESMPLKSPVDFAMKTRDQQSAGLPPHLPPLLWCVCAVG